MKAEGLPSLTRELKHMTTESDERGQALEDIQSLRKQGWYWSDTTRGLLLSPGDPAVYLWHNGGTGELTYSPKIVNMMARLLREEDAGR